MEASREMRIRERKNHAHDRAALPTIARSAAFE